MNLLVFEPEHLVLLSRPAIHQTEAKSAGRGKNTMLCRLTPLNSLSSLSSSLLVPHSVIQSPVCSGSCTAP